MQLEPESQPPAQSETGLERGPTRDWVAENKSNGVNDLLKTFGWLLELPDENRALYERAVASLPPTLGARPLDQQLLVESTEELADLVSRLGVSGGFPVAAGFSSARLKPGQKAYQQGWQMGYVLKQHGWALITGGGPGGMKAISRGASGGDLFAATIELPFEKDKVTGADDPRRLEFKHFHTRKRALVDRPQAFFVIEGGFGTLDELFEALCLIQTGKRPIAPVVLVERPGSGFWTRTLAEVSHRFVEAGVVSPNDDALYAIFDNVDDASAHILDFYRHFHSVAVDEETETLTIRLQPGCRLDQSFLDSEKVKALVLGLTDGRNDRLKKAAPSKATMDSDQIATVALPHYQIRDFNQRSYATLRELIDIINGVERERVPALFNPLSAYTESLTALAKLAELAPVDQAASRVDMFLAAARAVARDSDDLKATLERAASRSVKSLVGTALLHRELAAIAFDHDQVSESLDHLDQAYDELSALIEARPDSDVRLTVLASEIAVTAARTELRRGNRDIAAIHVDAARSFLANPGVEAPTELLHALRVTDGLRAHLDGEHELAIEALKSAVAIDPAGPYDGTDAHTTWMAIARSLVALRRPSEARALLDSYTEALTAARQHVLAHGVRDADLSVRIGSALVDKAISLGAGTPNADPQSKAALSTALKYLDQAEQTSDLVGRLVEVARVRVFQGRPDALDGLTDELARAARDDGRRYRVERDDDGTITFANTNGARQWRATHRLRLRAAIATLADSLLELHGERLDPAVVQRIGDVRDGALCAASDRLILADLEVNENHRETIGLRV